MTWNFLWICRDCRFCNEKMRASCKGRRKRDRRHCEVCPCCKLRFAGGGDVRVVLVLDWRILRGDSEKHDCSTASGWASGLNVCKERVESTTRAN